MLMAVKNQFKISLLSVKYAIMREMLNKTTFITNVLFMILNNACMIVQWIVLFSLKENVGGYTFNQVMLLWGIAASTYGFSHLFFENSYHLSELINNGKLDSFLVQPKNVLLSVITTDVKSSALGDFIYGYLMVLIFGLSPLNILLFTLFVVLGGIILTCISIILGSLAFWFSKSDIIAETGNRMMVSFSNYPDGIFKGIVKILFYTLIPVGFVNHIPVKVLTKFDLGLLFSVVGVTVIFVILAFVIFYRGLKRYSSSNLMIARF